MWQLYATQGAGDLRPKAVSGIKKTQPSKKKRHCLCSTAPSHHQSLGHHTAPFTFPLPIVLSWLGDGWPAGPVICCVDVPLCGLFFFFLYCAADHSKDDCPQVIPWRRCLWSVLWAGWSYHTGMNRRLQRPQVEEIVHRLVVIALVPWGFFFFFFFLGSTRGWRRQTRQ